MFVSGARLAKWLTGIGLSAVVASSAPVLAQQTNEWTFVGQVAPRQTVEVANQINGIVKRIHVTSGQRVRKGELLVSLDDADAKIDLAVAEAALEEADAKLKLAIDIARRQKQLASRGTGREALAVERSLEAAIAKAQAKQAEARLDAARLALDRTMVKAPIDGTVGRLRVATGAFVEAEGGTVLLEIIQLDPVLVSYAVPFQVRQQAMANAGTNSVAKLLKRLRLSLRLPGDQAYSPPGKALFESARIDPQSKALKVWAEFPNADRTLIPGLEVRVISRLAAAGKSGAQ